MAMRMAHALGVARGIRHPLSCGSRLFALPLVAAVKRADHQIVALQPAAAALLADLAVYRMRAPRGGACVVGPIADRDLATVLAAHPVDAEETGLAGDQLGHRFAGGAIAFGVRSARFGNEDHGDL